jgi:hypothetical protein
MHPLLFRSTCLFAVILTTEMAKPISAQTTADLKARCDQLIAYFDRYGASRIENSDGVRNHTRIGAMIDCDRGFYEKGIKTMEDLLRRKKFTVPPPSMKLP